MIEFWWARKALFKVNLLPHSCDKTISTLDFLDGYLSGFVNVTAGFLNVVMCFAGTWPARPEACWSVTAREG